MAVKGSSYPGGSDPGFIDQSPATQPFIGQKLAGIIEWNGTKWVPYNFVPGGSGEEPPIHSVLTYGADPTGVKDSTAAFKECGEHGNLIYAPTGTYLIAGTVELGGKTLVGDGVPSTKFIKNSLVASMFTVKSGPCELRDFTIENLNHKPTSGAFIDLKAPVEAPRIINISIFYPYNAIQLSGTEVLGLQIDHLWVRSYQGSALALLKGSNAVMMTNFFFYGEAGVGDGIYMEEFVAGSAFENGEIFSGKYGIYATAPAVGINIEPNANRFTNVYFDTNSAGNILNNCTMFTFTGCWFATPGTNGVKLEGECGRISFMGCDFYACKVGGNVTSTCKNTQFVGCHFNGCLSAGVEAEGSYFIVQGCTFSPATPYTEAWGVIVRGAGSNQFVVADNIYNGLIGGPEPNINESTALNTRFEQGPVPLIVGKESITAEDLAPNSVIATKIKAEAVVTAAIKLLAITTDLLAEGSVTSEKLAAAAVGTVALAAGAVTETKLAAAAVGTVALAAGAVTETKLAAAAVGTVALAEGAVAEAKLGGLVVSTPKIKAKAVTSEKLAEGVLPLVANAPVKRAATTYEFVPSTTKNSIVLLRVVSMSLTACEYKVLVGGEEITTIVDPSITGSINMNVSVPVPKSRSFKLEKISGELAESFTQVTTLD